MPLPNATSTSSVAKARRESFVGSRWPKSDPTKLPMSMVTVKGAARLQSTASRPQGPQDGEIPYMSWGFELVGHQGLEP